MSLKKFPKGFISLVRADLWRCSGRSSFVQLFKTWLIDPAFRPVFTMRLVQYFSRSSNTFSRIPFWIAWFWHRRTQFRCGVDLPWSIEAGAGLKLLHGWGVVINDRVKIGENVTIMQGVTIGGTGRGIPILEDDVIVCANATVIGEVTIGIGAVIGAGCVVTKNVAPYSTVVGNPQKELVRRLPPKGFNPLPPSMRQLSS